MKTQELSHKIDHEKCAYKGTDSFENCLSCNGYPEQGCWHYTTKSHIQNFSFLMMPSHLTRQVYSSKL